VKERVNEKKIEKQLNARRKPLFANIGAWCKKWMAGVRMQSCHAEIESVPVYRGGPKKRNLKWNELVVTNSLELNERNRKRYCDDEARGDWRRKRKLSLMGVLSRSMADMRRCLATVDSRRELRTSCSLGTGQRRMDG